MGNQLRVEPEVLETTAQKIETQASDYEATYKSLFDEVDGMAAIWQGEDNVAFVNQVKGFMDDYQKMTALMKEYSQFLKQSATAYKTTQQDVTAKARTLTN